MAETITKTDDAWRKILETYPIEQCTSHGGIYEIEASEIKKFREPRLMTKFDTSKLVADPLQKLHLNVLPSSRHSYVIGKFQLYEKFPDVSDLKPISITLPNYETLRTENITSESNAINALLVTNTLEKFLEEENQGFIETFNGRMGTDDFSFDVNLFNDNKNLSNNKNHATIAVNHAQLEIDGGFESKLSVSIMEAKNIIHDDFNIRQLYFPYRKYLQFVHKPIRLIFSQYTNLTYYLYEYKFLDPNSLSSIHLVKKQAYKFDDRNISMDDLINVWRRTRIKFNDDQTTSNVPFVQADRFDRLIALLEHLNLMTDNTMSTDEITEFMGTTKRQAAYYPAAGEFLGIFDRSERGKIHVTQIGMKILQEEYKERQLSYVELIFEHKIFHDLFKIFLDTGKIPDKDYIVEFMLKLNVCNYGKTVERRASSVSGWLKWIINLVNA